MGIATLEVDVMLRELVVGSGSAYIENGLRIMDPKGLLDTLDDEVRWDARALVLLIGLAGWGRARVVCGRRTLDAQRRLFGKGRDEATCAGSGVPRGYARPGEKRVTWCNPEDSKHVSGRAFDVDFKMYQGSNLGLMETLAAAVCWRWGGEWKARDYGHFEV